MKTTQALQKFRRKPTSEKVTLCLFFVFFVLMAFIYIYPILFCFFSTFKTNEDFYDAQSGFLIWPAHPQFDTWSHIFEEFTFGGFNFWTMLWNSIWFTVLKLFCTTACSMMLAYAVARYRFPGRGLLYATAIFVQTIPIFGSGSTAYKLFDALNMVNNPALFWIAWCSGFDMTFIILHGVFKGISKSYSESAKIDGASNVRILFSIMIPLAAPTIIALLVTDSIGVWNDYATIQIYLRDYATIAYGLYCFPNEVQYATNPNAVYYAAMLISMLPVAILYACNQKIIMTNITVGGLKG